MINIDKKLARQPHEKPNIIKIEGQDPDDGFVTEIALILKNEQYWSIGWMVGTNEDDLKWFDGEERIDVSDITLWWLLPEPGDVYDATN